ncbi:NAD-dependent protein deacetylase sirtuin-7 [Corythoichthys intestinalis]|uniref:NAD-dependent protein deacetylase sirtuin-7 n=1 Tax=Corythoichthys intestinalis TaxID=161448 RepID=UPI0025A4D29D|nr:NAD-dependent protein deacetylase sirtuin-7 [Corythoichthys intestinalis]XP_061792211.1 NAD-dependent protein deacetylase sirtuin-7-like [Nerophis lumbriciformis]
MANETDRGVSSRAERKALQKAKIVQRENEREIFRLVGRILKKPEGERSEEETSVLMLHRDTVDELCKRKIRSNQLKRKQEEVFDTADDLKSKVRKLAVAVKQAKHLVVYTGAGISTAASIPDYRGPNGIWTQLQKGRSVSSSDLSKAEPTLTHMCIWALYKEMLVKHVVSQNCDGLHLRSGLPRHALSELHGNMFIEVCTTCSPVREYVRLFDVTERTSLHRHGTGRSCCCCGGELRDTIVHFGERGTLEQPLNWKGAAEAAKAADVILCLGSSLKVLKKYACLWCMNRPASKRPKLYIINLQWTPKDDLAVLKINAKCDDVMSLLMEELNIQIPIYDRAEDPIFSLAVPLQPEDEDSHTRAVITPHAGPGDSIEDGGETTKAKAVQGGWFGRGYGKGRKKKKAA